MNDPSTGAGSGEQRILELMADSSGLKSAIDELISDLTAAPREIREQALDFISGLSGWVAVDSRVTSGAAATVFIKPSQKLRELSEAIRARDLTALLAKYAGGEQRESAEPAGLKTAARYPRGHLVRPKFSGDFVRCSGCEQCGSPPNVGPQMVRIPFTTVVVPRS